MIGTKEATKIPFLDEQPLKDLRGSKIPLKMDVFRFFFFLHLVNGLPLKDASQQVVSKTKEFWEQVVETALAHVPDCQTKAALVVACDKNDNDE